MAILYAVHLDAQNQTWPSRISEYMADMDACNFWASNNFKVSLTLPHHTLCVMDQDGRRHYTLERATGIWRA